MSPIQIIEIVVLSILVLGLGIYYLVKAIKNKWLGQIIDAIQAAIKEAEKKFPEGHGEEKKAMVIEAAKAKCIELGIPYELLYSLISKLIDTIVNNYNVIAK